MLLRHLKRIGYLKDNVQFMDQTDKCYDNLFSNINKT